MSVRSKALRYVILVAAAVTLASCALAPAPSADDAPVSNEAMTGDSAIGGSMYGDSGEMAEATGTDADAMISRSMENLEVSETKDLTPAGSAEIAMQRGTGFTRLNVATGSAEPVVDVMMLAEPARLVIDVLGDTNSTNSEIPITDDKFLSSVRVGAHQDRTRYVFDLKDATNPEELDHVIDTANGQLIVTFLDTPAVLAASADSVEAQAPAEVIAALPQEEIAPAVEEIPAAEMAEMDEEAVIAEEEVAQAPIEVVEPVEVASGDITLESLNFEKTADDAGEVLINLSDSAAFEMRRTAPSEYVLTLPGVEAASRTTVPQIAPKSFPGIRSARAVANGETTLVRMFVDEAVTLEAFPRGNEIVVKASAMKIAQNPSARAQLEATEGDGPEDETAARRNPTGIRSADGSKIYTGRLISLDLQDTDIDNALRIIAEVSNLNIIASDDVSGKVTLRLIDVPWDQALDVILKTNGLDQVTEGNVIRIAPVDKLRQEREALREAKQAAENLEDLTVQYVRVSYARVGELVEQVATVLSERGSVVEDERTNQLIVKDIKKGHEQSLELIKRLDLRTPQVLLETQIIEGQRNILRDLGFQWNFTYNEGPEFGNATGNNFPNSIAVGGGADGGDAGLQAVNFPAVLTDAAGSAISAIFDSADGSRSLAARLSALETEGKVKVISRPQVATVNNKTAEIKSVETVRVRLPDSGTSIATGSGASASGGGRTAFEEIDVGIELTVTPQASPDYYVLMDVVARSSTFGSTVVDNIPSTLEREATSTILVKSGQTFALGGIYRIEDTDQVQGVPFLKDIPFLGVLFRRSFIDKSDEELIFFITPHIVEGSFDPSLM